MRTHRSPRTAYTAAAAALLVTGAYLWHAYSAPEPPPEQPSQEGTVEYVVDGDTVHVALQDGSSARVRALGIDTPERGECYAEEATTLARSLLPEGQAVTLTPDPGQPTTDVYNRLLAYVDVDGTDYAAEALRAGTARPLNSHRNPLARATGHAAAAKAAQAARAGLWTACAP